LWGEGWKVEEEEEEEEEEEGKVEKRKEEQGIGEKGNEGGGGCGCSSSIVMEDRTSRAGGGEGGGREEREVGIPTARTTLLLHHTPNLLPLLLSIISPGPMFKFCTSPLIALAAPAPGAMPTAMTT